MINTKYKLSGNGLNVTTIRDLNFKKGQEPLTIPIDTKITIFFTESHPSRVVFDFNDVTYALRVENLHSTVKGPKKFGKTPSTKSLEKMVSDGICTTVTGFRTEPDGYGEDGSPSWLICLGMI